VALLFSGGRDSSLSACLLATLGKQIHLLSFIDGISVKSEISDFRVQEIKERFPENIIGRVKLPIFGLFRSIAIKNIESDFDKYKKNLVLLGNKLAMQTAAIVFCLQNSIPVIADGSAQYQSYLAEQMPDALTEFRLYQQEYGIEYLNPVWHYISDTDVKYQLFEFGISTKSLEGISIFGDSFTQASPEIVVEYIRSKLPICRAYVSLMIGQNPEALEAIHNPSAAGIKLSADSETSEILQNP
jgi:hypothetical protein